MPELPMLSTLFPKLTDDQLACVRRFGREEILEVGAIVFRQGEPEKDFCVVLEGEIEVVKRIAGEQIPLAVHHPGEFTGAMSMFTGAPSIATAHALCPSRIVRIDVDAIKALITGCPDSAVLILTAMAQRRPAASALAQQHEKLAALGQLSAGLAHELNNPAAAAQSAARQLGQAFVALRPAALNLGSLCLSEAQGTFLLEFEQSLSRRTKADDDALARSDMADATAAWLETRGLSDPWQAASDLTDVGVSVDDLEQVERHVGMAAVPTVVTWLATSLSAAALLCGIEQSMDRVTGLVKAIKSYSYMDQAQQQQIDIHESLDSTLTILGYKLKNGIEVVKDYDRSLPKLQAYGGELNQVWTNLIDNALYAARDVRPGRITIHTKRDGDFALVEICDNGTGIPDDVMPRLFEPFFTTKGVGEGTGLGLDASRKIIVDRHHGDIRVVSEPGDTRFQVRLPLFIKTDASSSNFPQAGSSL